MPATAAQDLERDATALHWAVSELVRVYQFRDRDKICCYDISVTQCYALETLVQRGPMRLQALATELFLDKSTTSRVAATLVRKKYVQRTPEKEDGRAVALEVTSAGQALYRKINRDLIEQQEQLLQDLNPKLRASVADVIQRLARAADARFRSGVSVCAAGCAPGSSCEAK